MDIINIISWNSLFFRKTLEGVHVKMWVDLVRARMFFNYVCDEHNNWALDTKLSSFLL